MKLLCAELVVGNAVRRVMHLIREIAASEGLHVTSDQVFTAANPQPCAPCPGRMCTVQGYRLNLVCELRISAVCVSPKRPSLGRARWSHVPTGCIRRLKRASSGALPAVPIDCRQNSFWMGCSGLPLLFLYQGCLEWSVQMHQPQQACHRHIDKRVD